MTSDGWKFRAVSYERPRKVIFPPKGLFPNVFECKCNFESCECTYIHGRRRAFIAPAVISHKSVFLTACIVYAAELKCHCCGRSAFRAA